LKNPLIFLSYGKESDDGEGNDEENIWQSETDVKSIYLIILLALKIKSN